MPRHGDEDGPEPAPAEASDFVGWTLDPQNWSRLSTAVESALPEDVRQSLGRPRSADSGRAARMPRHGDDGARGASSDLYVPIAPDSLIKWRSGAAENWSHWRRLSAAVPADMRESFIELRDKPDARVRTGTAAAHALGGVALYAVIYFAMGALYFGDWVAERCGTQHQDVDIKFISETFVGALPGLARSVLLVVPASRHSTGPISDAHAMVTSMM